MKKFRPVPVVIDGNLILNAISSSILGTMDPEDFLYNYDNSKSEMYKGRGMLIKTFFNYIFGTIKDISATKKYSPTTICVVWDKKFEGKYKKTEILDSLNDGSTYKSDRKNITKEDLEDESLSDKDLKILKSKYYIGQEFLQARVYIQRSLPKIGIPSAQYPGWEADDIDYLWGLETNFRSGLHIHVSGDSDWQFHLTKNDIHWQVNRNKLYIKTVKTVREKFSIPENLTLMEWAARNFSALGSHNNLLRTVDPSIKRFTKKYKDKLFSEEENIDSIKYKARYLAQKKTFYIESFKDADKIISLYDQYLPIITQVPDNSSFNKIMDVVGIKGKDRISMEKRYENMFKTLSDNTIKQL